MDAEEIKRLAFASLSHRELFALAMRKQREEQDTRLREVTAWNAPDR